MNTAILSFLGIIAASFCFSLPPILTKLLYHSFTPIPVVFIRFLLAAILALPLFFLQKKVSLFKATKEIWPYVIFSSLNMLLFAFGIARTTADSGIVIYCDVPLIAAILAYFFLKEKIDKKKLSGILLGLMGITFVAILPFFQKGAKTGDLIGNLLVLAATFSWALYVIFSKRLTEKGYSPTTVSTVSFIVSTILFALILPFTASGNFIRPLFNLENIFLFLILSGVATVGSFFLTQWVIKRTTATTASLTQYLQPVFTVIFAAILLGERVTGAFLIGAVFVLAGVFIATYSRK